MPNDRQTIVHNVRDEPMIVQQADGTHIIVPAHGKRSAKLPSEIDSLLQSAQHEQSSH